MCVDVCGQPFRRTYNCGEVGRSRCGCASQMRKKHVSFYCSVFRTHRCCAPSCRLAGSGPESGNCTALHAAVEEKHPDVVQVLIDALLVSV